MKEEIFGWVDVIVCKAQLNLSAWINLQVNQFRGYSGDKAAMKI